MKLHNNNKVKMIYKDGNKCCKGSLRDDLFSIEH